MVVKMPNIKKEEVDIKKNYGEQSVLGKEEFIIKYNVKKEGLSNEDAVKNLNQYGKNEIKQAKPKKWYNYFISSLLKYNSYYSVSKH